MKTILKLSAVAVLFVVAPSPCFALWDTVTVSKKQAKERGMEVRMKAAGPNRVQVTLEFKTEGQFKAFSPEGKFTDRSGVQLQIHEGDDLALSAPLREDRSKSDRVVVSFTADRTRLDQIHLLVMVPFQDGAAGGTIFDLRMKDFVEVKKDK